MERTESKEPHVEVREIKTQEEKENFKRQIMENMSNLPPICEEDFRRFVDALENIVEMQSSKIYFIEVKSNFTGITVNTEALSLEEAKQDAKDLKSIVDQRGK
jgi:hypothetical protein